MNRRKTTSRYEITWLIRRLFRAMTLNANKRLALFDMTAADRAVLEFLSEDENLTVPEVANRYQVSRQHVQVIVNRLLSQKLICTQDNPHHKRSSLLSLTGKGRKRFARIREGDDAAIDAIFEGVSADGIRVTKSTLQTLLKALG